MGGSAPAPAALPERIGPYRVLRLIGEGGMGRVYLARQDQARREVALKLLRPESQAGDTTERFQREIELLARLEHPNIARLYDAGSALVGDAPVRYLAMEYVAGPNLTGWALGRTLAQRVQMLAAICRTLHYAHTRGVIHRDLKPDNILVDAAGEPRVLDFGIARGAGPADLTAMTVAGQLLGTIAYMSPEQLGGAALQPDPRTDVYALGVLAYELIGGSHPFPAVLQKTSLLAALDSLRMATPERLGRLLPAARGDLETIVGKALAAEPGRRYGSAAELATDFERYLDGRPVEARPPTVGYVVRLLVRRHRALSAALLLSAISLLAGAGAALSFALAERQARREADSRVAELDAVNRFLQDMLAAAAPERTLGRDLGVRELLDSARVSLDKDRSLPAGVVMRLRQTLGDTFVSLGQPREALRQLEPALAQARAAYGADARQALSAELSLAAALRLDGRSAEAEPRLRALLARVGERPGREPAQLRAQAASLLGDVVRERGDAAAANALLADACASAAAALGASDPDALACAWYHAQSLWQLGRYDQAYALHREVLARRADALGAEHPRVIEARESIAILLREWGRYDESLELWHTAVDARTRVMGRAHRSTLMALQGLGATLWAAGQYAAAEAPARESLAGLAQQLGADHENLITARTLLAVVLRDQGRHAEAEPLLRAELERARVRGHVPQDVTTLNHYGLLLLARGRYAEARDSYAQLLALAPGLIGAAHPSIALYRSNYGEALGKLGERTAARAQLELALPVLEQKLGTGHPRTKVARERLAAVQ